MKHGNSREVVLKKKQNGCVICTSHAPSGSGRTLIQRDGKKDYLYRVLWEEVHGTIPYGLVIRHRCHNHKCVNIEHLQLGTQAANLYDKATNGTWGKKLSWDQVENLRTTTGKTNKQLSTLFGISVSMVEKIKSGKSWNPSNRITPPNNY